MEAKVTPGMLKITADALILCMHGLITSATVLIDRNKGREGVLGTNDSSY